MEKEPGLTCWGQSEFCSRLVDCISDLTCVCAVHFRVLSVVCDLFQRAKKISLEVQKKR